MFADSLKLTDGYAWWWSYIGHFIRSPFYCYAYAFANCWVLALYQKYSTRRSGVRAEVLGFVGEWGIGRPAPAAGEAGRGRE